MPRAPIPVAVALAVLAVLATVAPEPAAAQTVTTFISNTEQTTNYATTTVQAVAFTTGAGTYTLVAADLGTTVKVTVSFTDDASNAETLTSAATAAVTAAANTPATGAPTITGTAQVGQVLTATVGTIADVDGLPDPFFSDAATTIAWIRVATDNSETNIASATASTYTLVDADQGTTTKVRVSFTDDASNAETLPAGTRAIMDADGLTTPSYTYQWIRVDGGTETNISGAIDQGTTR